MTRSQPFKYHKFSSDKDPALVVRGHINDDSVITSNHGIHVGKGFESSVEFVTLQAEKTVSAGVPTLFNQQQVERALKVA